MNEHLEQYTIMPYKYVSKFFTDYDKIDETHGHPGSFVTK